METKIWLYQDSLTPFGAKANYSTSDNYMSGASGEVISLVTPTCAQSMLRATPLTKGGLVESLQIWNNGHPDQIGHF